MADKDKKIIALLRRSLELHKEWNALGLGQAGKTTWESIGWHMSFNTPDPDRLIAQQLVNFGTVDDIEAIRAAGLLSDEVIEIAFKQAASMGKIEFVRAFEDSITDQMELAKTFAEACCERRVDCVRIILDKIEFPQAAINEALVATAASVVVVNDAFEEVINLLNKAGPSQQAKDEAFEHGSQAASSDYPETIKRARILGTLGIRESTKREFENYMRAYIWKDEQGQEVDSERLLQDIEALGLSIVRFGREDGAGGASPSR